MKAVRIHQRGGPDVMMLEEIPQPVPGPGQVLIEVVAAGVNYADIGQRTGAYPNLLPLPATLGYEAAGLVAAVGPGVGAFAIGQRVVSLVEGGYAEFAVAEVDDVVPLPDGVDYASATAIPIQGMTADLLLTNAVRMQPGASVLVHVAAGGVGSLAVQLARLRGASLVIGSTRSPAKANTVRALGADLVINTNDADWPGQVMAATQGKGVDAILDSIGGDVTQGGLSCLATLGRLVVYGGLSERPSPFVAQQLIPRCQSVAGYNTQAQPLADRTAAAGRLAAALASGDLRVLHGTSFPLRDAAAAHEALAAGTTEGKVVLGVADL